MKLIKMLLQKLPALLRFIANAFLRKTKRKPEEPLRLGSGQIKGDNTMDIKSTGKVDEEVLRKQLEIYRKLTGIPTVLPDPATVEPPPLYTNEPPPLSAPEFFEWYKGRDLMLSEHFSTYEFECACDYKDCKTQRIKIELVDRLERLRISLGEPLRINEGYRCKRYHEGLGKKGYKIAKKSQHLVGAAVDLRLARRGGVDYSKRVDKFFKALPKLFKAIGKGKGWAHVDLRDDKERRWGY